MHEELNQVREKYKKILSENKTLSFQERLDLIWLTRHSNKITAEYQETFLILLEYICAEKTLLTWSSIEGHMYKNIIVNSFLLTKKYINNRSEEEKNILSETSKSLFLIYDFTTSYAEDEPSVADFFDNYSKRTDERIQRARYALYSMLQAITKIKIGFNLDDYLEPDYDNPNFLADNENMDAADNAFLASGETPLEFWTWYIDVAFPQALAEVPKYLNRAEG